MANGSILQNIKFDKKRKKKQSGDNHCMNIHQNELLFLYFFFLMTIFSFFFMDFKYFYFIYLIKIRSCAPGIFKAKFRM